MPKPAKQLDSEIAAALSKIGDAPAATGEFYYAVYPDDEHLKLYGPYETWKDAAFAGYFHKSADERARVLRTRNGAINFFGNCVEQHNTDAIKALISYPREFKLKSVKIVRRTPPMHASWKQHTADSRQIHRNMDWKYAEEDRDRLGR
jgi:hypothetical protein